MSRWLTSSMGPHDVGKLEAAPELVRVPADPGGCVEAEHGPVRDDDGPP